MESQSQIDRSQGLNQMLSDLTKIWGLKSSKQTKEALATVRGMMMEKSCPT